MNLRTCWRLVLGTLLTISALASVSPATAQETQEVRVHSILQDGNPYYDACYQLFDFSNIGCDENGDGIVTFQDVPVGEYVLMQTADIPYMMAGPVAGQGIEVEVRSGNVNDLTVMLLAANPTTDVSLITRYPADGTLVTGVCYELVGYSNIGCDENGDGQVDFADIPYGTYTVRQTTPPAGYPAMDDYQISLSPIAQPGVGPAKIHLIQAKTQGSATTGQVSVVLLKSGPTGRAEDPQNCVQIPGLTNVGCDDAITDGQIDFVDVDVSNPNLLKPVVTQTGCGYVTTSGIQPVAMVQYGPNTWVVVIYLDTDPHTAC